MKRFLLLLIVLMAIYSSCSDKETVDKDQDERDYPEAVDDRPAPVKASIIQEIKFNYEFISNGIVSAMRKADMKLKCQEFGSEIHVKNEFIVHKGDIIAELGNYKLRNDLLLTKDIKARTLLDLQDVLIGRRYGIKNMIHLRRTFFVLY